MGEFQFFEGDFDALRIFGVQWEPEEFVSEALHVTHPMDATSVKGPTSLCTGPNGLKI